MSEQDDLPEKTGDLTPPAETDTPIDSTETDIQESIPQDKPRSRGGLYFFIFLLFALVAGGAGAGYWGWQQIEQKFKAASASQGEFAEVVEAVQSESAQIAANNKVDMTNLETRLLQSFDQKIEAQAKAQQENLQQIVAEFSEREQVLLKAVQKVTESANQSSRDWKLSEIEYLLTAARSRLLIAQDVISAEKALRSAAERIKAMADPNMLTLQEAMMGDIANLIGFAPLDYTAIASELKYLSANVSKLKLPLSVFETPEVSQAETLEVQSNNPWDVLTSFWNELTTNPQAALSDVVKIEKTGKVLEPTPAVEIEGVALKVNEINPAQSLYLQLVTARMSALNQDAPTLVAHLSTALEILSQDFDESAQINQNMIRSIESLRNQLEKRPETPDIQASLAALAALKHQAELAETGAQQ